VIAKNFAFVGATKLNYRDLCSCHCSGTKTATVCVCDGLKAEREAAIPYTPLLWARSEVPKSLWNEAGKNQAIEAAKFHQKNRTYIFSPLGNSSLWFLGIA